MLFVQSAVDECNLPQDAATLLHDAGGGFFLKLLEAGHFAPYVGQGRRAGIVERLTVAFLKRPLAGTPRSHELSPAIGPAHVATLLCPFEPLPCSQPVADDRRGHGGLLSPLAALLQPEGVGLEADLRLGPLDDAVFRA